MSENTSDWNRINEEGKITIGLPPAPVRTNQLDSVHFSVHSPVLLMQISFDSERKPAEMKAFVVGT